MSTHSHPKWALSLIGAFLLSTLILFGFDTTGKDATPASMAAVRLSSPYSPLVGGTSLRFYGNGVDAPDLDRVKIRLDGPPRPVDVGATDFTVEFWMKAEPGANGAQNCVTGNDGWITGNIILDRDIYGDGDLGDWGISLYQNGLAVGVNNGSQGAGICGNSNLADNQWHHVAVQRRRSDGRLWLFVNGTLQAETDGPDGDISYRDGRSTSFNDDPFLVIGAEKHDAGSAYPSFNGWIDELRISTTLRYSGNFTRPSAPFAADAQTAALYHLDEGSGDVVGDSSGAAGGPSNGVRRFGGSPAGPVWSADTPWNGVPATATLTATATPILPTSTATPTNTPVAPPSTSTPTATATATAASTAPSTTPTATATGPSTPSDNHYLPWITR